VNVCQHAQMEGGFVLCTAMLPLPPMRILAPCCHAVYSYVALATHAFLTHANHAVGRSSPLRTLVRAPLGG